MSRASITLFSLLGLIAVAGVFEILVVGPLYFDRFLVEGLFMSLTLQAGHVAWTYFLIAGDRELRLRFPWVIFLLLNLGLFLLFWFFGRKLHAEYAFQTAIVYNALRIFHDTQQGYGVASLLADGEGVNMAVASPAFRGFLWPMQVISIGGMALGATLDGQAARLTVAVVSVSLTGWLACRMVRKVVPAGEDWRRSPSLPSLLLLGRFTLLGVAGASRVARTMMRMTHGVEYAYAFVAICKRFRWYIFAGAIGVAVLVQLVEVATMLQRSGIHLLPRARLPGVILNTVVLSHMFQDWYIFSRDKVSAKRLRALYQAQEA